MSGTFQRNYWSILTSERTVNEIIGFCFLSSVRKSIMQFFKQKQKQTKNIIKKKKISGLFFVLI
jgi:hypothetical protein